MNGCGHGKFPKKIAGNFLATQVVGNFFAFNGNGTGTVLCMSCVHQDASHE